jgi:hypothetical protein
MVVVGMDRDGDVIASGFDRKDEDGLLDEIGVFRLLGKELRACQTSSNRMMRIRPKANSGFVGVSALSDSDRGTLINLIEQFNEIGISHPNTAD